MGFLGSGLKRWGIALGMGLMAAIAPVVSLKAAENIFFTYGPVKVTVPVEDLARFVETGQADGTLGRIFFLMGVSPEDRTKLREILQVRPDVSPVLLSKFFNSSLGENILERAGVILNIPWQVGGKYAIRGAVVQAAADPQNGLTLLNFLQKYPTDIHISGEVLEDRARAVEIVVRASEYFIQQMILLSQMEAQAEGKVDFSTLPNPVESGPYGVQPKQTWWLTDTSRDRRLYVDVYRPQQWRSGKTPVVVLSHGLASRPEDFDIAAQKLASYGFVVALPQHPGSDFLRAQAFLEGTTRSPYLVQDFIDRPKDISFIIDELERRNSPEFGDRLELTRVGVGGHSFGGYGVLATAGATIDWEHLKQDCDIAEAYPNTALILQCDALTLPQKDYEFKDPRVVAVLAANPVNSSIFGISGLRKVTVPVLMMGGSYDPATPFVLEQVRSFPRLGSQEKYLTMMEGQAHVDFSRIDANVKQMIQSVDAVTLPDPNLLHSYGAAVMVPFFQVYVAQDERFRPLLDKGAAYAAHLSEGQEFKFYLISQRSEEALIERIIAFRRNNGLPIPDEFTAKQKSVAASTP